MAPHLDKKEKQRKKNLSLTLSFRVFCWYKKKQRRESGASESGLLFTIIR